VAGLPGSLSWRFVIRGKLTAALQEKLGIDLGETTADGDLRWWNGVPGRCGTARGAGLMCCMKSDGAADKIIRECRRSDH